MLYHTDTYVFNSDRKTLIFNALKLPKHHSINILQRLSRSCPVLEPQHPVVSLMSPSYPPHKYLSSTGYQKDKSSRF